MTFIKKLNKQTYYLDNKDTKMMLTQKQTCYGKVWEMYIANQKMHSQRNLIVREFDTLEDVEKYYKSWKGLCKVAKEE